MVAVFMNVKVVRMDGLAKHPVAQFCNLVNQLIIRCFSHQWINRILNNFKGRVEYHQRDNNAENPIKVTLRFFLEGVNQIKSARLVWAHKEEDGRMSYGLEFVDEQ